MLMRCCCLPRWTRLDVSNHRLKKKQKSSEWKSDSAWLANVTELLGFYIWVFPKIMVPPNHPFVHGVFHYFHLPFWGPTPIFGNIHVFLFWDHVYANRGMLMHYVILIPIWLNQGLCGCWKICCVNLLFQVNIPMIEFKYMHFLYGILLKIWYP